MATVQVQIFVTKPITKTLSVYEGGQYRKHWSEGGLSITNFSDEDLNVYANAIAIYGDSNLCIAESTLAGKGSCKYALSYRETKPENSNLGEFWKIFEEVREFYKPLRPATYRR